MREEIFRVYRKKNEQGFDDFEVEFNDVDLTDTSDAGFQKFFNEMKAALFQTANYLQVKYNLTSGEPMPVVLAKFPIKSNFIVVKIDTERMKAALKFDESLTEENHRWFEMLMQNVNDAVTEAIDAGEPLIALDFISIVEFQPDKSADFIYGDMREPEKLSVTQEGGEPKFSKLSAAPDKTERENV